MELKYSNDNKIDNDNEVSSHESKYDSRKTACGKREPDEDDILAIQRMMRE